jgi:preprotein translocase subunit YajC
MWAQNGVCDMFISEAWAQAAGGAGGGMDGLLSNIAPLLLIFVVFYFLLIRPQQRKAKEHREMLANVRRGDQVVTGGGFLGKVTKVLNENEIEIELAEGVRVRALKGTLQNIVSRGEPAAKDAANKEAAEKPAGLLGGLFGRKK